MKKYNIEVVETLSRVVEMEANNYYDAENKVEDNYNNQKIVLDWNDLESTNYKPFPSQRIKKDINLEFNYSKKDNQLIIGTDNSSGANYYCKTKEDMLNSIKSYIDNYIEFEKIKPERKINMER